jgi:hypothetical protein
MAAWKGVTLALAAASLMHPAGALAHEGEDHAAAGGGELPPVVAAPAVETPAPGAQPAAPANIAAPAAQDTAAADEAAANGIRNDAAPVAAAHPTTHANHAAHETTHADHPAAAPQPAVQPVADGGGTADDDAASFDATPPAVTPAAGGELPFTGPGDTILIIALAGMFAPIGVLLYCAARRGELRWLRRHLAMPRFEWTER